MAAFPKVKSEIARFAAMAPASLKDKGINTRILGHSSQCRCGAKAEALATANKHCAQQGKKLLLDHITSSECALHGGCGKAEIMYLCLAENDPCFKPPHMKKEADTTIELQNR